MGVTSLNTQLLLKRTRTRLAQFSNLKTKANTGYFPGLSFLGCLTGPTSSWVNERSSQYLIYLVILSNSQSGNQFLHIAKKEQKKYQNKKYIYIYTYSNIASQSNSEKCHLDLIHISDLKPLGPSFFSRDLLTCSHTFWGGSTCDRN